MTYIAPRTPFDPQATARAMGEEFAELALSLRDLTQRLQDEFPVHPGVVIDLHTAYDVLGRTARTLRAGGPDWAAMADALEAAQVRQVAEARTHRPRRSGLWAWLRRGWLR